ncbi:PAS domain-containing protein [Bacillus sp. N9]
MLDGTKVLHHQTIRMKKDGSLFPVLLIVAPIFDGDGKIIAISAITKDLSELMKTKLMIEQQKIKIAEQERLLLISLKTLVMSFVCLIMNNLSFCTLVLLLNQCGNSGRIRVRKSIYFEGKTLREGYRKNNQLFSIESKCIKRT